jgi:ABC-type glycerol-3-phosphate transport system substrate-binding protein
MGDLTTAQTSLGSWYVSLQNQPLNIDSFKVGSPDQKWKNKKASIFQKLGTTFSNFLVSFTKDYDNVGGTLNSDVAVNKTIDVWVSRGTEWAEVIKEMADEDFTPKTGVKINLNVLPASQLSAGAVNALMLSITAGKAPDVALGVSATSPVDFAIRDTVYDLSKMKDYDKVAAQFVKGILTPYEYRGGVYAVPETMNFNVMFYRKDIMDNLKLPIPNTWNELYNYVLPVLSQNGLEFGYSKDFTPMLFQHGGSYYKQDGMKSALDSAEAYKAFLEYCQLYTNYGVPKEANIYNHFRNGLMPMGVGNFGTYMQLMVAAPELAGKWAIAPLPGTLKENGVIDRSCGGLTGEGDIILKQTENPEESWEFLKWWTSADVQTRFAREVEAIMGAEARWNTANVEAFTNLAWKAQDLQVLNEQWKWTRETPNVLGGYFTSRHITNAWTTAVISGGNVRDTLENAVKEINRELKTKQEEYGIFAE